MCTHSSLIRSALVVVLVVVGAAWGFVIRANAQSTAQPKATMAVHDEIRDGQALLPLQDWVPLANIVMSTDLKNPADRTLTTLTYTITADNGGKRDWVETMGPDVPDLLEFGLFLEGGDPKTDYTGILDPKDHLLIHWAANGSPYGQLNSASGRGNLIYNMDFSSANIGIGPNSTTNPSSPDEISLILCVRTSPYWQSGMTLGYTLPVAVMSPYLVSTNGTPVDSYPTSDGSPFLAPSTGYCSSFNVEDITSGPESPLPSNLNNQLFGNAWDWPHFMYTPTAEHMRPRWDIPGDFFDYVTGQWLNLRNLVPLENWTPLIGINLHSTAGIGVDTSVDRYVNGNTTPPTPYPAMLREVNVVVQGVGGDPLVPGSNGFNPVTGLDTLTNDWLGGVGGTHDANYAVGDDFAFNGLWVFHDTNGNGVFDPPTTSPDGGVTFTDYPMIPAGLNYFIGAGSTGKRMASKGTYPVNFGVPKWEYVPFPPDGGAPWWTIKLELFDGARRPDGDTSFRGYVQPTPNSLSNRTKPNNEYAMDYFVVARLDSGYQDVSLKPGDGTGFTPGTSFRAFIEPRRFNAATGHEDGGIYVDSQCPTPTIEDANGNILSAWQDDPRWTASEPWWPERTLNATNAKLVRSGVEVHDLTLLYNSNSAYASTSDIDYQGGNTYGFRSYLTPVFANWLDPLGLQRSHFYYGNTVGVTGWRLWFNEVIPGSIAFLGNNSLLDYLFPYETVPFYSPTFDIASSPRSVRYSNPPAQPTLPDYSTWPGTLTPGMYPQASDWLPQFRRARLLQQHIEPDSEPTAMLGFNLVGADDPVTNRIAPVKLTQITVAFWGPDFVPGDLMPLDPNGLDPKSGVLLYQDDGNGVFDVFLGNDTPVPLANLAWRTAPEYVDLNGDGKPDDLNGDGVVDDKDRAWVLTLTPHDPWVVPISDEREGGGIGTIINTTSKSGVTAGSKTGVIDGDTVLDVQAAGAKGRVPGNAVVPVTINLDSARAALAAQEKKSKAFDPGGNPGDDLFLVIRTSDAVRRFEHFRVVVPATLPDRPVSERKAGIKLYPNNVVYPAAFTKTNPDEGAGQDYFKHDMMEVNVPTKLVDLTTPGQIIGKNSPATAILGIDASTNRGSNGTAATGMNGVGGSRSLTVSGATWTPGAFVGDFLVDSNFSSYQITANTATTLTLLSGTPKSGYYLVAKDPTFLETVTVEFYDNYDGKFKLQDDLMPLDIDPTKSGVALYRDNTFNPANTPGVFDPGIDIPVQLDFAPYLVGATGQPGTQVRFVFSTPGTDNLGPAGISEPLSAQPRHRQWIPDTFDAPFKGPDFFVVIRTSNGLQVGDGFSAGIVSWGPNTPTAPDPDTFPPFPTSLRPDEYNLFNEFPWGSRAVGYITFFQDPTKLDPPDLSGFNWVRSTIAQAIRTNTIYGGTPAPGPNDVTITSVSRSALPAVVGANGLSLTITGTNFGTAPQVQIAGITMTVNSATDTSIDITIPPGTAFTATPVLLRVTNTVTGSFAVRDDLFTLPGTGDVSILSVTPNVLPPLVGSGGLPITITGVGFGTKPQVTISANVLTITSATDTTINAVIPAGVQFFTLPLVLTVTNPTTGSSQSRDDMLSLSGPPLPPPNVVISSTSVSQLPSILPSTGITFTISGSGFGTSPTVALQGKPLVVTTATNTLLTVTIPAGTSFTDAALTLTVTNPISGNQATRSDLLTFPDVTITSASISQIPPTIPAAGLSFNIVGSGFGDSPVVTLQGVSLLVQSATDTKIAVTIPGGTSLTSATLTLSVTNSFTGKQASRDDLFVFPNVVITSVSVSVIPATVPSQGLPFNILGSGFGNQPRVTLQGQLLDVRSASDTEITVVIPGGATFTTAPLTLTVTNTETNKQASRSDLLSLAPQPSITSVTPNSGTSSAFPLKITGANFDHPHVYLGGTLVPVLTWTSTSISVGFPTGGLPTTGALDVTVENQTLASVTLAGGFTYSNPPVTGSALTCFIATAAYGTPFEAHLTVFRHFRDAVLLKSSLGAALVEAYYTYSPAIADRVAAHPLLAWLVRLILTPVAWSLEEPVSFGAVLLAIALCAVFIRRWRRSARARRLASAD